MKSRESAPALESVEATETRSLLEEIITQPQDTATRRVDGIALGIIDSIDAQGVIRISAPALQLHGLAARSMVAVAATDQGAQVALGFEGGYAISPIILGFMHTPAPVEVIVDRAERQCIEAEQELELRCGEASIILNADGRILLRGTYITSHASATQRILGGSVNVN